MSAQDETRPPPHPRIPLEHPLLPGVPLSERATLHNAYLAGFEDGAAGTTLHQASGLSWGGDAYRRGLEAGASARTSAIEEACRTSGIRRGYRSPLGTLLHDLLGIRDR